MKNLWSEILVPAVIAGLTVIGTVGVESARTVRPDTRVRLLREVRLDTLRRDTVPQDTGKKAAPVKKDTVLKDLSDDNFDFFGETVQDADTTPKVFARDTMKVPDSLRTSDPFLYRWYVAIKDSLTHRIVVDSDHGKLLGHGDSRRGRDGQHFLAYRIVHREHPAWLWKSPHPCVQKLAAAQRGCCLGAVEHQAVVSVQRQALYEGNAPVLAPESGLAPANECVVRHVERKKLLRGELAHGERVRIDVQAAALASPGVLVKIDKRDVADRLA